MSNNPELAMLLFDYWMGDVKPEFLLPSSSKNVWIKCSKKQHITNAPLNRLNYNKESCGYCGNKKPVVGENDLENGCPLVAEEWDYEKNFDTPLDVSCFSSKYRWFICPKCLNSYRERISNRTSKGYQCTRCSSS